MNLQEINARLAEIAADIEARGDAVTAEELTAYEAEVTKLKEQRNQLMQQGGAVEQRRNLLASIAEGRKGAVVRSFPNPAAATAGGAEQRGEDVDVYDTVEYRRAFMGYVLRGTPIPAEYRADAVTSTSDVGAVIPTTTINKIVDKLESSGMIIREVTQTAYRGGVSIPTSSAKPVATWVNEGAGSDKQKKTTGSITFAYHKLRCAVSITLETGVMALSAFESVLTNNVSEAMVKAIEAAIISGNGTGKPKGILAETPPTGQALSASAVSYSDLVNAEAALPLAYENGAKWCMTKKTFMAYAGLQDTNGQPIGRVNYGIDGKPERVLLGRPVILTDDMDSYSTTLTANKIFAFLFNFKDYVLNTNYGLTVKRYEDNDTDDEVTKAIMLVDGKVVDKNSLVTIKKVAAS